MNKTISINISGLNFTIEEDAYYKLQNYIEQIKKHCGSDTDVEEVISDIESGISEKLKSLITPYKDVITMEDIDSLITIMGTSEDFDREVGGTYEEKTSDSKIKRKLYRDPDDVVVAGVASGLGVYFDIDPVIFRVAFFLLVFASGFGIFAYIVLWVAMPEAKTANQKLEMRGETPTIMAFEKLSKMEKKIKTDFKERWDKFPTLGKILSIPILIFNGLLNILKKFVSKIGPMLKFLMGLFLIVISLFGLGVVGVGSLYLLLQINSSYSFSFIPIAELIKTVPFFWLVITGFISFAMPAVLLLMLGLSFLRKKAFLFFNFNLWVILVSVWMIAGISFCAFGLRYTPDVLDKIRNYPDVQITTRSVDVSDVDKIIVNGSYIEVLVDKNKDIATSITGRVVDINSIEIRKENKDLILTWKDLNKNLCFNCSNRPIKLIISKENLSKIKLENGAHIIK